MFSGIWNFVKRHRRKFIFSGFLVGGVWLVGKYAKRRLIEFQEKEAAECLAHAKRQHHFDSNQRTCNMTVLSMLPSLREALQQALDTEALTAMLKNKPGNKLEIWEQLKILSFTRTVSCVYSVSLLISLLRVQLNIIGGYMYVDTLLNRNAETEDPPIATPHIQQRYLANVQYLLEHGLTDLIKSVQDIVTKIVSNMSLKQQISLSDMQAVISEVRKLMEFRERNGYHDSGASNLVRFMMPRECPITLENELSAEDEFLMKLHQETLDMLESGDFHSIVSTLLDSAFSRLLDKMAEYYKPSAQQNGTIVNLSDISMPLAKVVPIVNGLLHTICADAPNAYVQELLVKEQVKDFAANIYEAFSQPPDAGAAGHTIA